MKEFSGEFFDDDFRFGRSLSVSNWKKELSYSIGSCAKTHPAIKFGQAFIYGGSCLHPYVDSADIYVGLDNGMERSKRRFPWEPGEEVLYPISDMHAPRSVNDTKKMVEWLCNQLHAGQSVHIGCMGGHGRTGTILAALLAWCWDHPVDDSGPVYQLPDQSLLEKRNFVGWLRKNYCKKAVESTEQIKFLEKWFKVAHVEPTKEYKSYKSSSKSSKYQGTTEINAYKPKSEPMTSTGFKSSDSRVIRCMPSGKNIWAVRKPIDK